MEALNFGVPMFCMPQMDEQEFTAAVAVQQGVACASLKKHEVSVESLRTNLEKLINDPSYTETAHRMMEDMHAGGGCVKAAEVVIDYINKNIL